MKFSAYHPFLDAFANHHLPARISGMNNNHSRLPRSFWCGPAPIFVLLLGVFPTSAAHAQTALSPAIREELAVLHDAKDVSPEAIGHLCEIGDASP